MRIVLIIIICISLSVGKARAMSIGDPALATAIFVCTTKASKMYFAQNGVMGLIAEGHNHIEREVDGTYNLHKEFNDYLDSFRSVIVYAAQTYGFYYEIDRLVDNLNSFTREVKNAPTNALAVALSQRRNDIYLELVSKSIDIVNDIRTVCFSNHKMTEKERVEIVFGIRPKLKTINKKLRRLTIMVRYTTLADLWYELTKQTRSGADKFRIAQECIGKWKFKAGQIRPK